VRCSGAPVQAQPQCALAGPMRVGKPAGRATSAWPSTPRRRPPRPPPPEASGTTTSPAASTRAGTECRSTCKITVPATCPIGGHEPRMSTDGPGSAHGADLRSCTCTDAVDALGADSRAENAGAVSVARSTTSPQVSGGEAAHDEDRREAGGSPLLQGACSDRRELPNRRRPDFADPPQRGGRWPAAASRVPHRRVLRRASGRGAGTAASASR
jgi:hypothetical protein